MAPYHILIVIIGSVIPENLVLLTKSEQSGPESEHIRPTISDVFEPQVLESNVILSNFPITECSTSPDG